MTKAKTVRCAVIASVPRELRRKLDAAAKRAGRTRSAELRIRLQESLNRVTEVSGSMTDAGA